MSETWYVVPAAFALRGVSERPRAEAAVVSNEREETQSTWILPEAWRKAADPHGPTPDERDGR